MLCEVCGCADMGEGMCYDGKDRCLDCCMCVYCVQEKAAEEEYYTGVVPCKGKCIPKKMRLKTWWKRCGFDYKCRCAYKALLANPALAEEFIDYSH